MESRTIYEDIALRTSGEIYIGVVGPVRTGKSTFIKRFMESLVLPNIDNEYRTVRARDELPQSSSGRTIMTAEPKFVPEEAVGITLCDKAEFKVRLIDCVGYMIPAALGVNEEGEPRMVSTPWSDRQMPMTEAAEIGTKKVIAEHSTIGLVVTTDGSVTDIPREEYVNAEERVIGELKAIDKPFIILLNSAHPKDAETEKLRADLAEKYGVTCIAVNCLTLDEPEINEILQKVLFEFPVSEMRVNIPGWVLELPSDHGIKAELYNVIFESAKQGRKIRDAELCVRNLADCDTISNASVRNIDLGSGMISLDVHLPRELFYSTLSKQSGFDIKSDGDLLPLLTKLKGVNEEYKRVEEALNSARDTGYGIVMPNSEEMKLEEPEIVKHGSSYGVKLRASAPSIHMLRADITTEVSPIVGSEKQSEELVTNLLSEFESDPLRIWDTNIFGKSLYELVNDGLHNKLVRMPEDARERLSETIERIINESCTGLICIII
ncbi:MAG: stage IV sporulation protein A [Clostridia bacterium]|nr:stage IV sporulation protein A [Clostridia bacterium]